MPEGPESDGGPERIVAGFARALRGAGLAVPTGSTVLYAEALGKVGLGRREGVYWAGRATLVRRPEDVATYDRVFESYWLGRLPGPVMAPAAQPVTLAVDDDDGAGPEDRPGDEAPGDVQALRYSAVEALRER
ncbi:MAG: vWA domain-containing protein, partial [Acidimicrobiales bacterium]